MKNYKTLCSINLPIQIRDKLEKEAQKKDKHMNEIVTEVLEAYFAKQEKNQRGK